MAPDRPFKGSNNGEADQVIEFSIPSRLELLGVLDQLVQAIASQLDFDQDAIDAIATSLIEAGTNAIQHGHGHDASQPVWFRFLLGERGLDAWVADQGTGFDLDAALSADPTRPEDLYRSRGRGIFIMRAMMDSVEFDIQEGRGVTVHLRKERGDSNTREES